MTLLQAIVLGVVQGLTEFLPVSSSAHLILVPWFLGWEDGGLTFDVALHAGTLVALMIYFRCEWIHFIKAMGRIRLHHFSFKKSAQDDPYVFLAIYIVAATIPGAIIGLLLEKKAEHAFRDPRIIAFTLTFMGLGLWLSERKSKKIKTIDQMTLKEALWIGLGQGMAVIPGISRSGITIAIGMLQNFNRVSAARFSFFLSMPIIAGACLLKLRHLTLVDLTPIFISGVLAAAISGYAAIGGLMRFVQTRSYGIFAIYRVLIGVSIFLLILFRR